MKIACFIKGFFYALGTRLHSSMYGCPSLDKSNGNMGQLFRGYSSWLYNHFVVIATIATEIGKRARSKKFAVKKCFILMEILYFVHNLLKENDGNILGRLAAV